MLIVFFSGLSIVLSSFLFLLWWNPFRQTYKKQANPYKPFVSVIIPVKGVDEKFPEFLNFLRTQTYANAEYLFCLTDNADPAIPIIRETLSGWSFRIIISEPDQFSCDQIQNNTAGLNHMDPKTEVVAFIDADGSFASDYIRAAVEPLQDEQYVCSSTHRKYQSDSFGGMIIKYWNEFGILFKNFPLTRFAWGGGMVFRRRDLESLGIPRVWDKVLSNDMSVNLLIAERGWKTYVVKQYAASATQATFLKAVLWISRQESMMFFYHKTMHFMLILEIASLIFLTGLFMVTRQMVFLLPLISFFFVVASLVSRCGTRREWALLPFIFLGVLIAYTASCIIPFFIRKIRWGDYEYHVDGKGTIVKKVNISQGPGQR